MKILIIMFLSVSFCTFGLSRHEELAQRKWRQRFADHKHLPLISICEPSLEGFVISCKTHPISRSGDGDAYTLLSILSFMPKEMSESGKDEIIGEIFPTW